MMKVMIVNELMTGDISPVATFNFEHTMITGLRAKVADSSGSKSDQFEKSKLDKWSFFSLFFWKINTIDVCESLVLVFHPSMRWNRWWNWCKKIFTKNSLEKNSVVIYTIDGWWQVAGWQGVTRCIFTSCDEIDNFFLSVSCFETRPRILFSTFWILGLDRDFLFPFSYIEMGYQDEINLILMRIFEIERSRDVLMDEMWIN